MAYYMRVPTRRKDKFKKRESGAFLITAAGLKDLKKELLALEESLPALIADVEHTKSHGDFSENAAYQDAKHKLRQTHARIAKIKDRIKRAVIIEQGAKASESIQIGSRVDVEVKGKKLTFEILGSHESDPSAGRISNISPLGKALLNHSVGDEVVLQLDDSEVLYTILEIR